MDFKEKTIIVTGANSGVGKSTSILLAQLNADVIGVARRAEKLEEVREIIEEKGKGSFTPVAGDITNPDTVQKLFDTALEKFGKVDILINNAGVLDGFVPVGEMSDELWNKVLTLNLTAPMLTMKQAVNIMKEQKQGGAIVNVGSLASLAGATAGAAYTASKHGLAGLTKNTAAMYRSEGIRCNMVCPGGIATPMAAQSQEGVSAFGSQKLQAGLARIGGISQPEEIAQAIIFLASDEAAAINGVILPVDLGFMAF